MFFFKIFSSTFWFLNFFLVYFQNLRQCKDERREIIYLRPGTDNQLFDLIGGDDAIEENKDEDVLAAYDASDDAIAENDASEDVIAENDASEDAIAENDASEDAIAENDASEDVIAEYDLEEDVLTAPDTFVAAETLVKPVQGSDL